VLAVLRIYDGRFQRAGLRGWKWVAEEIGKRILLENGRIGPLEHPARSS